MLRILLAGLFAGILVTAPMGPMAALAALKLGKDHSWAGRKDAALVAAGVITADVILAALSLGVLQMPVSFDVPEWFPTALGAVLLVIMGVVIWIKAKKEVVPVEGMKGFGGAFVVSLIFPGNVLAYLVLFSGVLPLFGLGSVQNLGWWQSVWLLISTTVGLGIGWACFLVGIEWAVKRFGRMPTRWRRWLGQGIGAVMIVMAVGLVVKFFY